MIVHLSQTVLFELVANTLLQKTHLLYTIDLPALGLFIPK